jgi:hypothetical protein
MRIFIQYSLRYMMQWLEDDEPKRDPTKADEIHRLYFEDNDGFFPPAWLGKDTNQSERRSSNDSTSSHGPKD